VVSTKADQDGFSDIILGSTLFYPDGGGQPCDTGTLAGLSVLSVVEAGDDVVHRVKATDAELKAAGIVSGATIRSVVDVERRRGHSEQHTAQHLLSSVLLRLRGAATLSFHLGERYASIDLDIAPLERAEADTVEDEVLHLIRDDYQVTTHLCPPENAASFPLRKEPSVETGVLRVVEIDGLEYSACCGTHVRSTGALGLFRIIKIEKYKVGCRVHFLAGGRAFADYRRLAELARDAAAVTGTPEDEVVTVMAANKNRIKALERSLDAARDAAAAAESRVFNVSVPPGAIVYTESQSFDAASRLARALARLGRISVVSCLPELKAVACSPAPTEPGFKPVDSVFGLLARDKGGSGGGGKAFFQAAFPDAASLEAFMASARHVD
jgi:alanyl-tRNA synthetase